MRLIEYGESADKNYAKIVRSRPKQVRAPAARPKEADDEESCERPDSVRGRGVRCGVRVAKFGSVLWRWLPVVRADQGRAEFERPKHPSAEAASPESKGSDREGSGAATETRSVTPFSAADSKRPTLVIRFQAIMPRPLPRYLPHLHGAACARQSLSPQFPPARNRSARIPSNSCRVPGSWK
jgi:hypothetical protein